MNCLERWFLERICKKLVVQGPAHKQNIVDYYKIIRRAAKNEFTEDNDVTLDAFMSECHKESKDEGMSDVESFVKKLKELCPYAVDIFGLGHDPVEGEEGCLQCRHRLYCFSGGHGRDVKFKSMEDV